MKLAISCLFLELVVCYQHTFCCFYFLDQKRLLNLPQFNCYWNWEPRCFPSKCYTKLQLYQGVGPLCFLCSHCYSHSYSTLYFPHILQRFNHFHLCLFFLLCQFYCSRKPSISFSLDLPIWNFLSSLNFTTYTSHGLCLCQSNLASILIKMLAEKEN